MITTTISDFRKNIKKYFNSVDEDMETLIINRGKEKGVVVLSLNEYNSLLTTNLELSSNANQNRLDDAIAKLKTGNSFEKDLIYDEV
ncbi:MAG: type II toxin-antitoxin system Phd/YefM family antitoxin [Melioribacteraceae bacterium]|nr:type II toxin-antitoxin system Phd/YefM family antitoxin [Melioribacteraceae bacterium]